MTQKRVTSKSKATTKAATKSTTTKKTTTRQAKPRPRKAVVEPVEIIEAEPMEPELAAELPQLPAMIDIHIQINPIALGAAILGAFFMPPQSHK